MRSLIPLLCVAWLMAGCPRASADSAQVHRHVVVLVYHRFGATVDSAMTVRMQTFEAQLRTIQATGYRIVALADVVDWQAGNDVALPERAVAITVDDGHRSVYETLWPAVRGRRIPVTLFIYPSAISNASYAMTWAQLRELVAGGQFDVQSHTYWHPDFRVEQQHRGAEDFSRFVHDQLRRSRTRLETETARPVHLLAWPFGIHGPVLERIAQEEGYIAGFTLEAQPVRRTQRAMALPRYLMTDRCGVQCMADMLRAGEERHE